MGPLLAVVTGKIQPPRRRIDSGPPHALTRRVQIRAGPHRFDELAADLEQLGNQDRAEESGLAHPALIGVVQELDQFPVVR